MIKTVFIDIDNTLLDFNKNSALALKQSFIKNGLEFNANYPAVFIRINDSLWTRFEKKEITREQIYGVRYKLVLEELNLLGDYNKIETDYRDALFNCAEPVDGALETLKYLADKYSVYAASNAMRAQQENRLNKAGMRIYIKELFLSHDLGVSKPSKEFFDACISLSGAKREETIMIGDSLSADIKGAYDFGIKSVWYNHLQKQEPTEKLYDFKIDKLLDIKNIL